MEFIEFERIVSAKRMERYLNASNGNREQAIQLYRKNIFLSKEAYAMVSYFEVALRNAIDGVMIARLGDDWLRDSVLEGGIFDNDRCRDSKRIIERKYQELEGQHIYSHSKLLSVLEFGIWRYMFSPVQYRATGQVLLKVFPSKPKTTRQKQYNNIFFFQELESVNKLRNRIAHNEPICFSNATNQYDMTYLSLQYDRIKNLLAYMEIDFADLMGDSVNTHF